MKKNTQQAKMPKGFTCGSSLCGLKKSGKDLSIIYSEKPASAAAVFTQNSICGAPITVGREIIKNQELQALVINSKISNVGTGAQGLENAKTMGIATAKEFNISPSLVLMGSTGIIAKQLPMENIINGIKETKENLCDNPLAAAEGIMTTDTYPKAISIKVGNSTITIIGKGSGMIEPNMATMLVYILTDAYIEAKTLDKMLKNVVNQSFNMLSIDTDNSTSDTCVIMANGLAGEVDKKEFEAALLKSCITMTEMLAKDGEGATKLIRTIINNAYSQEEAKIYAKSVINSPLIKTMVHGGDPNIGRLLMAIGKCNKNQLDINKLEIVINSTVVFKNSEKQNFDEQELRNSFNADDIDIVINFNLGEHSTVAYGCDLTYGYIDENAAYYSS